MARIAALAAIFLGGVVSVGFTQAPSPQESLTLARQQADIFDQSSSPFQLEVQFVAQLNVPTPGRLKLRWKNREQWRVDVFAGGFEQVVIRDGEAIYNNRNLESTPLRLQQLTELLHFPERLSELKAKKPKPPGEESVEATCLEAASEILRRARYRVCLDPDSYDMSSTAWDRLPDRKYQELYSEYVDFNGHRYPEKLALIENGSRVITATVTDLTSISFDDAWLDPPMGSSERRHCAEMRAPVPLKTPQPLYPKSAKVNRIMGDTTVVITVEPDGSVGDVQLVARAAHTIDEATVGAVKRWKFKPALCGAEPVVSDVEVTMSFRLHP